MQKLMKTLLSVMLVLCFSLSANPRLSTPKAPDENNYQLIFLLNEEAYGVDVADQAVLAVSPENARAAIAGQLSNAPQMAMDLVSPKADHTDTTTQRRIDTFTRWDYQYEGIEGYIFPKHCPQPRGTVRLMRKYNRSRDDHAIFPETLLTSMQRQGYTENNGSDWLGYVYPL